MIRRFRLALALSAFAAPAVAAQSAPLTALDAYIAKAIRDWQVPGLSIAIVHNDSVVHARGYGVRKLGDPAPVNEHTIFAIGSASKAFTVAALGTLVDSGKLGWDDKVTKHLPDFQMFDPYVTRELSIRDLLSHRSGLSRGDRLWFGNTYDRDDILDRVRFIEPTWSFRSAFGYQNLMYLAGGQIAAKAAGKPWDDVIAERILRPLGMTRSSTSVASLASQADVSTPHARIDGKLETIPWRNIDNIAPAGSINSTARDMTQWMRLQLGKGTVGGTQILKAQTVREMHTANTVIRGSPRQDSLTPETHLRAYGLGWFLEDYRGRLVVHHGGNIDGMSALVWMVPEEKLGVVVLTNMNSTGVPATIARRVTDMYLGGAQRDWSADMLAAQTRGRGGAAGAANATRANGTKPSLALARYAGAYEHPAYGRIDVRVSGEQLAATGIGLDGELEHWHYDTFRAQPADRMMGRPYMTFVLDAQGRPIALRVDGLGEFQREFGRGRGRGGH